MKKSRGVSRTTAKSKLELFMTKANGWKPVTFVSQWLEAGNFCQKELHSSPRYAFERNITNNSSFFFKNIF